MLEHKICFHMSYKNPDGSNGGNGKMHYRGRTPEEAIQKALTLFMVLGVKRHTGAWIGSTCTSFTFQRGRFKGKNVKWLDYVKTPEGKALIKEQTPKVTKDYGMHSENWGWRFLED
jgi:hypothetical protein